MRKKPKHINKVLFHQFNKPFDYISESEIKKFDESCNIKHGSVLALAAKEISGFFWYCVQFLPHATFAIKHKRTK